MTKKTHNLYTISETEKLIDKENRRASRVFWFMMGFLVQTLLTILFLYPDA